jgi:hypothetical protein
MYAQYIFSYMNSPKLINNEHNRKNISFFCSLPHALHNHKLLDASYKNSCASLDDGSQLRHVLLIPTRCISVDDICRLADDSPLANSNRSLSRTTIAHRLAHDSLFAVSTRSLRRPTIPRSEALAVAFPGQAQLQNFDLVLIPIVGIHPRINHMKLNKHTHIDYFYRQACVSQRSELFFISLFSRCYKLYNQLMYKYTANRPRLLIDSIITFLTANRSEPDSAYTNLDPVTTHGKQAKYYSDNKPASTLYTC